MCLSFPFTLLLESHEIFWVVWAMLLCKWRAPCGRNLLVLSFGAFGWGKDFAYVAIKTNDAQVAVVGFIWTYLSFNARFFTQTVRCSFKLVFPYMLAPAFSFWLRFWMSFMFDKLNVCSAPLPFYRHGILYLVKQLFTFWCVELLSSSFVHGVFRVDRYQDIFVLMGTQASLLWPICVDEVSFEKVLSPFVRFLFEFWIRSFRWQQYFLHWQTMFMIKLDLYFGIWIMITLTIVRRILHPLGPFVPISLLYHHAMVLSIGNESLWLHFPCFSMLLFAQLWWLETLNMLLVSVK